MRETFRTKYTFSMEVFVIKVLGLERFNKSWHLPIKISKRFFSRFSSASHRVDQKRNFFHREDTLG